MYCGIDIGTSSVKALLVDEKEAIVARMRSHQARWVLK